MTGRWQWNRVLPFAVSFAATSLFFINVCAWLFQCGCHSLWAGADLTCNVHAALGRHCPFCSHGMPGYAGVFVLVCAPQLAAAMWSKWSTTARVALCLGLFPIAMGVVGLGLGWYEGYWL